MQCWVLCRSGSINQSLDSTSCQQTRRVCGHAEFRLVAGESLRSRARVEFLSPSYCPWLLLNRSSRTAFAAENVNHVTTHPHPNRSDPVLMCPCVEAVCVFVRVRACV
eukprot:scpid64668/ scgid17841/ 